MSHFKKINLSLLSLSLFFLVMFFSSSLKAEAANRYWVGGDGASINTVSSWATSTAYVPGASVPTSVDTVIFDGGVNTNATIDVNWTVSTTTIGANYTKVITQNTGTTWTVRGTFTNSGTSSVYSGSGTATVHFSNSANTTITTGGITFNNLNLTGTVGSCANYTTTFADSFTVAGNIIVQTGSAGCGTYTWSSGSAKTITLQGNFTETSGGGGTPVFGNTNLTLLMTGAGKSFTVSSTGSIGGNVVLNGTGITTINKAGGVPSGTVTINPTSGTVVLGANSNFYNLIIKNGKILDASNDGGTNSYNLTIYGTMTNEAGAVFTARAGTVTFNSNNISPTITTGGITFNNLSLIGTVGVCANFIATFADNFTITGNLSVATGASGCGTYTWVPSGTRVITLQGNYSQANGAGGSVVFGNANLTLNMIGASKSFVVNSGNVGANIIFNGTGTTIISKGGGASSGTTTIDPIAGTVVLSGNSNFFNLVIKNGKTLDASNNGGTNSYNIGIYGTMTNQAGAIFNARAGTVTFSHTALSPTITTAGITFNNLVLTSSESDANYTTTFADNFIIAGNLTVQSTANCCSKSHTWSAGSAKTITLQGNYAQTNNSGDQTIFGNGNLTLNMTGADKSFTVTSGIFNGLLTLTGTGTTSLSRGGTVGTETVTVNLTSGSVVLSGNSSIYNLIIKNGKTLDASNNGGVNSYNLTVYNTITNEAGAIFTGRAGTVTIDSTNLSPTITTGGITFNNLVLTSTDTGANYTTTFADNFTVAGNLTVQSSVGCCTRTHTWLAGSAKTITLQGNYAQSQASGVPTVFGSTNLTLNMTGADKSFTVTSGTFNGRLTFSGTGMTAVNKGGTAGTSETVTMNQGSGQISLSGASTFQTLNVSGALDLAGNNLKTIGILVFATSSNIKMKGYEAISNPHSILASSTVLYYGSDTASSTIKDWQYQNLIINAPGKVIYFPVVSTTTIAKSLTVVGSSTAKVLLRSMVPGTQWKINTTGATTSVNYADVMDSKAITIIKAYFSVGTTTQANNINWEFSTVGQMTPPSACLPSDLKLGSYDRTNTIPEKQVTILQNFLRANNGYLAVPSTGFFGLMTYKAVRLFQSANNINPAIGYVGPMTRQKINSYNPDCQ